MIQKLSTSLVLLSAMLIFWSCAESRDSIEPGKPSAVKAPAKPMPASVKAARGVLERLLPARANEFIFEQIPAAKGGYDVFEIAQGPGSKIIVRGNTGVSICSGLNWYLKYHCNCQVAWSGNQLNLPKKLPVVKNEIRKVTTYKHRVYLNYCVFSYTQPWWNWERWQREIDLMALNGVNMPLQVVGQEATWLATFKKLGLTDKEMQEFFVGPAYFAWAWMTNIDKVGGPLPMDWIKSHTKLGQKIGNRQRELGMTPILQAFTGHVPETLKKHYPNAKIRRESRWANCPGTFQMDPLDPLFGKIGKLFIQEQTKLFGTSHYYAGDPFHEGHPPSNAPDYMPAVGRAIFKAMRQADPKAKWVMQSWSLREAILKSVSRDDILVLDLNAKRTWGKRRPFWGRDSVWGLFNDMGGRTYMRGDLYKLLAKFGAPRAKNLIGFGMFDEAIEKNPIMFDALWENAWRSKPVNKTVWVNRYLQRRYGQNCPNAEKAWKFFAGKVYKQIPGSTIIAARPGLTVRKADPNYDVRVHYDPLKFAKSWELLVRDADLAKNAPGYKFDLVEIGSQALSNYALAKYNEVLFAWNTKDIERFRRASKEYLELLDDLDRLVATCEMRMLGTWIKQARSWGQNKKQSDLYEYNARCLVTLWESDYSAVFFDYSWRLWSGLIKQYYKPRWNQFFDMIEHKMKTGQSYQDSHLRLSYNRPVHNSNKFYAKQYKWEKKWVRQTGGIPTKPVGDTIAISRELVKKYLPKIKQAQQFARKNNYNNQRPWWKQAPPVIRNITSAKPVRASVNNAGERSAKRVVDGRTNVNGYWEAKGKSWLIVDLKKETEIDAIRLWTYYGDKRYYQYTVQVSNDQKNWKTVVDASKNTTVSTSKGQLWKFSPVKARYIKLNMLKNSANPSMHVIELWAMPTKK